MSQRREEIIQAARELIEEDPYTTPSVRKLARSVNISPAALYTHFRDLDDVLVNVRRSMALELYEVAKMATAAASPGESVAYIAHAAMVDNILAHPGLHTWMSFTNRLGTAGVERLMAGFLEEMFGVSRDVGERIVELTFITLGPVPALAAVPGVTRDQLVRYVHTNQMAMAEVLLTVEQRDRFLGALPEIPAQM